jgi:nitrogen fixation protein NifM
VRHILVTVNDDIAENRRDRSRAAIDAIRARLDGTREQFARLAGRHSECPSALEGGLLGRVPPGRLYAALDARLFAMQAGETSEPIESETGFHILYCEAIHPPKTVPFDEAAPKIRAAIDQKRREKAQALWLAALMRAG